MGTDVARRVYLTVGRPRSSLQELPVFFVKSTARSRAEREKWGGGVKLMGITGSKTAARERFPTGLPMSSS